MDRRDFLKLSMSGLAAIAVGSVKLPGIFGAEAHAATSTINLTMMEAMVEMFDKTPVYHWVFASDIFGPATVRPLQQQPVAGPAPTNQLFPSFPGPVIFATAGDTITLNVTNNISNLSATVPHAFQILGTKIKTGPIPFGETRTITFKVPDAGSYMYVDPLNAPINRVLGLHGALISLPAAAAPGHRITPYSKPTPNVQQIFDDLGVPGSELPPNQADVAAFGRGGWFHEVDRNRFRLWFINSTDPTLNGEIESGDMPTPAQFRARYVALYMMMNGRSGGFCSTHPDIKPSFMIGQPCLLRIMNAGMVQHSNHIHGNHVWVLAVNNQVRDNVFAVDVWSIRPMDRVDWLLPYRMPPDIPNRTGTGPGFQLPPTGLLRNNCSQELTTRPGGQPWPLQRPMPYPMHCHSEPSQAGAGGNYPGGLVTHWEITGDIDGRTFEEHFGPDPLDPRFTTNPV